MTLTKRLNSGPPLVMDGAMGTELHRRGVDISLPLWSAAALESEADKILEIHHDYVLAGAEILTTNTFRTTPRTYAKLIDSLKVAKEKAQEMLKLAVELTKKAVKEKGLLIAGSIAPLEDCYSPDLFPGIDVARTEYRELGNWLAEAGVDILLIETMGQIEEAQVALQVSSNLRLPRWVSFICRNEKYLLGGDDLLDAIRMSEDFGADAILINCTNLIVSVRAVERMVTATQLPVGLYPNMGRSFPTKEGEVDERYSLKSFEAQMRKAIALGVKIVGSCCGSTPEHTQILRRIIDSLD